MLMHASELADGNHWQKVIAREALKTLGDQDYCGVIHWNLREDWLWRGMLKVGPNRQNMLARLDRMTPGDMPDFESSMKMALADFRRLPDAAVKHMIIISDGDPSPPDYGAGGAITGADAHRREDQHRGDRHARPGRQHALADALPTRTGGKYYVVTNRKTLPRIYQKEARRVARPLVFERETGFAPQIRYAARDAVRASTAPAADHRLRADHAEGEPAGRGVGRFAAADRLPNNNPDAGELDLRAWQKRGLDDRRRQALGQRLDRLAQLRPVHQPDRALVDAAQRTTSGKFTVTTDVSDGKVRVVVTALDKDDEFLNFLNLGSIVVGPDMKPIDLAIEQTAPGRYVGEFDAKATGSYLLMVSPGAGSAPIRAGVIVPYSAEFRDRETNEALLKSLAGTKPKDGAAGAVIDAPQAESESKATSRIC